MFTYEFITPSDPITFKAKTDKIAYACALFLGNGKAGCHRIDENGNKVNLNTITFLLPDKSTLENEIKNILGTDLEEFFKQNIEEIRECFKSFAYGHIEDRIIFDDAIEAITDPIKLEKFKNNHEDRNRTSLSEWVKYAWQLGDKLNLVQ